MRIISVFCRLLDSHSADLARHSSGCSDNNVLFIAYLQRLKHLFGIQSRQAHFDGRSLYVATLPPQPEQESLSKVFCMYLIFSCPAEPLLIQSPTPIFSLIRSNDLIAYQIDATIPCQQIIISKMRFAPGVRSAPAAGVGSAEPQTVIIIYYKPTSSMTSPSSPHHPSHDPALSPALDLKTSDNMASTSSPRLCTG